MIFPRLPRAVVSEGVNACSSDCKSVDSYTLPTPILRLPQPRRLATPPFDVRFFMPAFTPARLLLRRSMPPPVSSPPLRDVIFPADFVRRRQPPGECHDMRGALPLSAAPDVLPRRGCRFLFSARDASRRFLPPSIRLRLMPPDTSHFRRVRARSAFAWPPVSLCDATGALLLAAAATAAPPDAAALICQYARLRH